jgi:cell division protein FtsA
LAEVVEPRYEELFSLVLAELRRSGLEDAMGSGIVLTGGSARMEGVIELAEEIFQMPVRLGIPRDVTGLADVVQNPMYSTAVGLLLYGCQNQKYKQAGMAHSGFKGFLGRMKSWFHGNF